MRELKLSATKSFIAQLMAFYFLALIWVIVGKPYPQLREIITGLRQMPAQIETILESQERYILELTHNFSDTFHFCRSRD